MLTKTLRITNARNAKTLSPSHMKQCIMSENRFDFLRELVKNIPDVNVAEDNSPSEHRESSEDVTSSPQSVQSYPSGSLNVSDVLATSTNRSNDASLLGTAKRSLEKNACSSSGVHRKYSKQHSQDSLANKSYIHAENTDSDTAPINYSMKISNDDKDNHSIKVDQVGSSPVSYALNNSQPMSMNKFMPLTNTKLSATDQPIINFDFSRIPILPLSSTSETVTSSNQSNAVMNTLKEETKWKEIEKDEKIIKQTMTVEPNSEKGDHSTPTVPAFSTDLALIKIDCSKFDFNAQSETNQRTEQHHPSGIHRTFLAKSLSKASASGLLPPNSTIPAIGVLQPTASSTSSSKAISNISNISYNVPISTVSNTLEMDEDYDNI